MKKILQVLVVVLVFTSSCKKEEVKKEEEVKFYLDENGVTCKCPNTVPGEKGIINGVEFESVDNKLLKEKVNKWNSGEDLSKICTSLVTSTSFLFNGQGPFNQPIGNWDVSNVETMDFMFVGTKFNQPIGNWNVSKVTDMEGMFEDSEFNQPIGDWNVSNVRYMDRMFSYVENKKNPFNQDISKWCVSQIFEEPGQWSKSKSSLTSENKPKWGTPCPN